MIIAGLPLSLAPLKAFKTSTPVTGSKTGKSTSSFITPVKSWWWVGPE